MTEYDYLKNKIIQMYDIFYVGDYPPETYKQMTEEDKRKINTIINNLEQALRYAEDTSP